MSTPASVPTPAVPVPKAPVVFSPAFPTDPHRALVFAVTSGKGGVGKTFVSANTAAALSKRGLRVLVLDADLGLANLDVVLNLYPKTTLHDVFTGKATLREAILKAPGGFDVLLAGSGLVEYSRLTSEVRDQFQTVLHEVLLDYDVVILDTGAGISDVVLYAISLADEVLLVSTPEPTSLTDAYATVKVLAAQQGRRTIRVVINQTLQPGEGRMITTQLQRVVDRFVPALGSGPVVLSHMGDIPSDTLVRGAVQKRQLLFSSMPGSAPAQAIAAVAGRLGDLVQRWQSTKG
jgi:flagellar biosynthesis protein FlhG